MFVLGLVFWLVFAGIVAVVASGQRREPILWFVIALLISPLIALVILLVVGDVVGPKAEASSSSTTTTLLGATTRELLARLEEKFNDGRFSADEVTQLRALAQREPPAPKVKPAGEGSEKPAVSPGVADFIRACPSCGRMIHPQATTCMHCWAKVAGAAAS